MIFFVFFFQAEDGIRDHCVTGVQTCALPIWLGKTVGAWLLRWLAKKTEVPRVGRFAYRVTRRTVLIHHALTLHIGQNPRPPGFDAVKSSLRDRSFMGQRLDGLREQDGTAIGDDGEYHLR